jgi:hypothetical protein
MVYISFRFTYAFTLVRDRTLGAKK